MKGNDKNATRNQKEYISAAGLDAGNWLVKKEDAQYLYLTNRTSGHQKQVLKKERERRRYGQTGRA